MKCKLSLPKYGRRVFTVLLMFLCAGIHLFSQFSAPRYLNCADCKIRNITSLDVDMDGDPDLVMDYYNNRRISWMENKGKGIFAAQRDILKPKVNQLSFYMVDFDGDMDMDIFTDHNFNDEINYYENTGNLTFKAPVIVVSSFKVSGNSFIAAYDFNLDGKKELVVSNLGESGMSFIYQLPDSTFSREIKYKSITKGSSRFKLLDLDADGDMDIVGQPTQYGGINFFENEGLGKFEKGRTLRSFTGNEYASSFDFADVDRDGDPDLVVGKYGFYTHLFLNVGNLLFTGTPIIIDLPPNVYYADIKFNDVDGDGDQDIVADSNKGTGNYMEHVGWYENYGVGKFSKFQEVFSNDLVPISTMLADIDGDGDTDLISRSYTQEKLFFARNLFRSPVLTGRIFNDSNENGAFDSGEKLILQNNLLKISPTPVEKILSETEGYKYFLDAGYYTVRLDTSRCWALTTPKSSYTFNVDTNSVHHVDFGVKIKNTQKKTAAILTSAFTRCGFTVPFSLAVENQACVTTNTKVAVVLHPLAKISPEGIVADSISGDTIWWFVNDLAVENTVKKTFKLQIAGVDFLGDTIRMPVFTYVQNDDLTYTLKDTFDFVSVINCSYDPNDKLVYPNRGGANYTLSQEELLYTIRFQNTGKDTAFNIELRDRLDESFDLNTLRSVDASHNFTAASNFITRELKVNFDNILLPDTATNFAASQGFYTFAVQLKPASYRKKPVLNQAGIYFDFNPPIATNTTRNTIVDRFICADSISPSGRFVIPMEISIQKQEIVCHSDRFGKLTFYPRGGIPPYFYREQHFIDSLVLDSIRAGTYFFVFTDSGNCGSATDSIQWAVPEKLIITPSTLDTVCYGATTVFKRSDVSGGVPPYRYYWNQTEFTSNVFQVHPGSHHLEIKDSRACTVDIILNVTSLDSLAIKYRLTHPSDHLSADGTITIDSVSGGLPPYTFSWSGGSTAMSLSDLKEGKLTLTITDSMACFRKFDFELSSTSDIQDPAPSSDITFQNPFTTDLVVCFDKLSVRPEFIKIHTQTGKLIFESQVFGNEPCLTVLQSYFTEGNMFFLSVFNNKRQTTVYKLIKI